jgi:hypothetical protein
VVIGFTTTGDPFKLPGCQFHVTPAPVPVKVTAPPGQTTPGLTVAFIAGLGLTVIKINDVEVHPAALVPVTV